MAKYREDVCKYYNCEGNCQYGRKAEFRGYCQKCRKYEAKNPVKHINRKKQEFFKETKIDF